MHLINVLPQVAEDALMHLARHVSAGVDFGRPLVAQSDGGSVQLLTDLCWWWVSDDEAARLLPLANGRTELTTWQLGREVSRVVGTK